ncbi:MAG: ABC transporter substrate-binding protein [Solirubrobacteraceae bacterium]
MFFVQATVASTSPRTSDGRAATTGRTLTIAVQNSTQVLPVIVGLRHGFFKKAGITGIKFILFTTLPPLLTAVAQGQADLGVQAYATLTNYDRATSGTKLKFIAGHNLSDAEFWATRNDSSVPVASKAGGWKKTVLAWRGLKIGLPAPGGYIDLATKWMLNQVGLTTNDVSLVYVGTGPSAAAALTNGIVDVTTGDPSMMSLILAQKAGRSVLPAAYGPPQFRNIMITSWFASDSAIQNDRATYTAFAQGIAKSQSFMKNPRHKKDIIDLLIRKIGLAPEIARPFYTIALSAYANAHLNPKIYAKTMGALVAAGIVTPPAPAYSDLVASFVK